jgi:hypothetical protein
MRKLGLALVLSALCAAALGAGRAEASPYALYGIQDDAWIRYGNGSLTERVMQLQSMGVGIVRFTLRWDEVAAVRPGNARNPGDPKYRWSAYDEIFGALKAAKIPLVVTIYGAPRWTNGGRAPNWAPTNGSTIASFAYAAQLRYPWIHDWTIWNEPNKPIFLRPTSPVVYTARLLNPAYAALHSASRSAKVAGGVTAPRAGSGGVSPVTWIRAMGAAHARLDVYAHNPYPASPHETPYTGGCERCSTITMATLDKLQLEVKRAFGNKRIWLTEYAYQVSPPDRRDGVSTARQAQYIGDAARKVYEAAGVDMLIHFLYRDEPNLAAWQSGLVTVNGSARPAFRAFELPLSQVSRVGLRTVLWGQVRPSSGARPYKLEQFRAGHWSWVGSTRTTSSGGFFRTVVRAGKGSKLRVYANRERVYSPILVVR